MKRLHLFLFSAVFGIDAAMFAMTAFFWNQLPARIPTHFGISGAADAWAQKSLLMGYLVPVLLLLMFLFFILLYRYPQYSSWPTTLILMTVEEEKREKIFDILRAMLSTLLFWIALLFAYLQFAIIATANGRVPGVENYVMIFFIAIALFILIYVNGRMFFTIRKMVKVKK